MGSRSINKMGRTPLRAALLAGATALAFITTSGVAKAGPSTATTTLSISSDIGNGNYGTVTLTQNGANEVDVAVTLNGTLIINTGGPHTPFAFNLDKSAATITNIDPGISTSPMPANYFYAASGSVQATPYGSFNYGLNYSGGNGSANGYGGVLSFAVTDSTGISISDFNKNGTNGYYFAADLSYNGNTGTVVADAPKPPNNVPEPGSLTLLGTGLLGLGLVARRKRRRG